MFILGFYLEIWVLFGLRGGLRDKLSKNDI